MKSFIGIFCIFVVVVSIYCKPPEEVMQKFEECAKEVGITEKPKGPPDFNDPKVKCLTACMMKKRGEMEDGKIDIEEMMEHHSKMFPDSPEDGKEILSECIETAHKESDECEVAASFMKCAHEKFGHHHHHHHKDKE